MPETAWLVGNLPRLHLLRMEHHLHWHTWQAMRASSMTSDAGDRCPAIVAAICQDRQHKLNVEPLRPFSHIKRTVCVVDRRRTNLPGHWYKRETPTGNSHHFCMNIPAAIEASMRRSPSPPVRKRAQS